MKLDYLVILDIIGTIAFALSGFIVAAKHKFDILGIIVISYVTAFGGGVIRDLLVDRPPFIFFNLIPYYYCIFNDCYCSIT
ncbi:MAG TPA: TRIC cation channel family protein [Saprospiraceae bacterium]|nr:TRIC cation channel family protein [Saprospiraceae bacterium]